jgi:hypothetical protein
VTDLASPKKTWDVQHRICGSTRWNGFKYRDNDVAVAT